MGFYATTSYPELPADNPSLIVAWCHLLQNCGKTVDPVALADYLSDFTDAPDWQTISAYDPELSVASMGNQWPDSKNSIVRFRIAGPDGDYHDLYCLIFDPANRTIIDSSDGTIKSAGVYGDPTGSASYAFTPTPEAPEPEDLPEPDEINPERQYVVLKGERIYDISRKLKIAEKDLIEHNNIDDPYNLPTGLVLHLPVPLVIEKPEPSYEVYETPQTFHISRSGGAQKWYFGNVSEVKDIISGSGMYPENKELEIYAVATVPVGTETFAYYMDGLALGDYKTTGKVKYTIGFSWADLTPGSAPQQVEQETPPTISEQIQETLASIEPIEEVPPPHNEPDESLPNPNQWKSTYVPLDRPETYVVDLPDGQNMILVHDLGQKRPSKRLRDTGHYVMAGHFWKDGVKYWRPLQAVQGPIEQHSWYGIPDASVKTEAQMYDDEPDLVTKLAFHSSKLSNFERYVIPRLAATKLSAERLKIYGRKLQDKTKEKMK